MRKLHNKFPLIILILILALTALCACQKTPEEKSSLCSVEFPSIERLQFICENTKVKKGDDITFSVEDGYATPAAFVLYVNGTELTPTDGVYTISNVQSDVAVTFSGAYDDTFTVSADTDSRVMLTISDTGISYGGEVTVTARLAAEINKSVVTLKANGNALLGADGVYTIADITANQVVTAEGIQLNTVRLAYSALENGRVTGQTSQSLLYGETGLAVTAVADDTYHFKAWSDGVLTAERTDAAVTSDKAVVAIFEKDTVELSWESSGKYGLTRITEQGKEAIDGDTCLVTYGEDFVFEIRLTDVYSQSSPQVNVGGSPLTGAEGLYTISSLTEAAVIQIGNLAVNKYNVNFSAPAGITFVYAGGSNTALTHGAEYSFSLTIDDYYSDSELAVLVNNQVVEAENGSYTIIVDSDKTVCVNGAEIDRCTVTFDTDGGLSVAPQFFTAGEYLRVFPAACRNDSRFIGWSQDGETLIDTDLLITEGVTLTALYQEATDAIYNISEVVIAGAVDGEVVIADMHDNIKITSLSLASLGSGYSVDTLYMGNNITTLTAYASSGALAAVSTIYFSEKLTAIPYMGFMNLANLTTIALPDSVAEIAAYAFYGSGALTSISGSGVTKVGENAFYGCTGLSAEFTSLESIGKNAFMLCALPDGIDLTSAKYIGENAFSGAFTDSDDVTLNFKDGVVIGVGAFSEARVKTITFSGAADIGANAFERSSLQGTIVVPAGSAIGSYAFCHTDIANASIPVLSEGILSSCGSLINVTVTAPIYSFPAKMLYEASALTEFVYPISSDIASVGDYAFYNAFASEGETALTVRGSSLSSIGAHAFEYCNINTLNLNAADNEVVVGTAAFAFCRVAQFNMSMVISSIGAYAFMEIYYSSFFDGFALTNGLTSIGQFAFENAPLNSLVIPDSVASLGSGAFRLGASDAQYIYFLGATPPQIQEAIYTWEFSAYVTGESRIIGNNCSLYVTDTAEQTYRAAWADYGDVILSGEDASFDIVFKYNRFFGDPDNYSVSGAAFSIAGQYLLQQPSNPSRQGYSFVGWSSNAETYSAFDFSRAVSLTGDLTLYAFWQAVNYPVLYNLGGGENNAANPAHFTVNDDIELLSAYKAGYYFDGFYMTSDYSGRIYRITNRNATLELYAKFVPNTYTLSFMVGGYIYDRQLVTYPNAAAVPIAPTLYDYDFEGWYVGDIVYDFAPEVSDNLIIVSKWTAKTYTYTFNAGGGTFEGGGNTLLVQGAYMTNITGPDAPTRYGYEFDGWRDSAGTIVNYPSYIPREDHTVYAAWNRKTFYITFAVDGGTATESGRRIAYDTEYCYLPVAVKTGYIFDGWYDEARGAYITTSSVFSYITDSAFTAKYTEISYSVSFLSNGGTGNTGDITLDYTESGILPACGFTRTGYTFNGWSGSAEGGTIYAAGTTFDRLSATDGSTVYYYAIWSENTYSVTFDANGGSGETSALNLKYSESGSLPACGFTRTGYTFVAWSYGAEGGMLFSEGSVILRLCEPDGASAVFYAVWEIESIDVTLYVSLGSAEVYENDVLTRDYNTVLTDFGTSPTVDGYDFVGWYDAATGGSALSFPYTVTGDAAFYAQMILRSYEVSFINSYEAIEAEGMPDSQDIEHNGKAVLPAAPTANGYTFTGWKNVEGNIFDFNTPITDDVNLFAGWELTEINYVVTLLQSSVFEDTESATINSTESALKSKITSGTISDNVTVTLNITENDILLYSGYYLEGYYSDQAMTAAAIFPYEVSRTFTEQDTIAGEESVTVNYRIYARYLRASSALSYSGNRAYLTANAERVIVPNVNNGVVITTFDGADYGFSSLTAAESVENYIKLAGFNGNTFSISHRTKVLDTEGLSDADSLTAFAIFNPKGAATEYTVESGVLYLSGALCCYPNGLSSVTVYSNSTVTEIMDYAFMNTRFSGFVLPNVEVIGRYAFYGAHINTFDFSVFSAGAVGAHAFDGTDISTINLDGAYASVFENGILPDSASVVTYSGSGDFDTAIAGRGSSVTEIIIIGFSKVCAAFGGMPQLNKVTVSDSCTVIGEDAFRDISTITSVILQGAVTEVQSRAFANTVNLVGELPATLTHIGDSAFYNSGLINGKDIDIGGYGGIGYYAFVGARITQLTTSRSASEIAYIFGSDIYGTLTDITITGTNAIRGFSSFTALKSMTVNAEAPVQIYANAFNGTSIKTFTYNSSAYLYIGNNAFYNCDSLEEVTVTAGNTQLASDCFAECGALRTVLLDCDITYIATPFRNSAVEHLMASFQRYTLADYVGSNNTVSSVSTVDNDDYYIKNGAFMSSGVSEVLITDNITYLSAYAFGGCAQLKSLTIPATVDYCERYLLRNTNLTSITMPGCFSYTDMLGVYDVTTLSRAVIIDKEGVSAIAGAMFKNVASLKEVILPASIDAIGEYAFYGCNLNSLNLNNMTSVGAYALYGLKADILTVPSTCTLSNNALCGVNAVTLNIGNSGKTLYELFGGYSSTLKYVNVTEGVTNIYDGMFRNYSTLLSVKLPQSIESIGGRAFMNCTGITGVYLGNKVTSIGEYAFYGCSSFAKVTVPVNAVSVGEYAFAECVRLETAEIKSSMPTVPNGLFSGCISLAATNIPNGVTAIGKYAYYNNTKLPSIFMPAAVSAIGEFAFWNNTVLSQINFTGALRTIGRNAFYGCASFTAVTLPNGITAIGDYAFAMCIKLTSINIPDKIQEIGRGVLENDTMMARLALPAQLPLLTLFGTEAAIPVSVNTVTYTEGNGYLADGALSNLLKIQKVIISEGIRTIGAYAFNNCENLTEIVLPSSLVLIKEGAFMDTKITGIYLSDSIVEIGDGAFASCAALLSVKLPCGLNSIGEDVFYACSALREMDMSECEKLYNIGDYAFMNCTSLRAVNLPSTVATIGSWAFAGCNVLTDFNVEENSCLNAIGHYAFKDCVKMEMFTLPVSMLKLGWGVFYNCTALSTFIVEIGRGDSQRRALAANLGLFIFFGTNIKEIGDMDVGNEDTYEYEIFLKYLREEGELQNVNE